MVYTTLLNLLKQFCRLYKTSLKHYYPEDGIYPIFPFGTITQISGRVYTITNAYVPINRIWLGNLSLRVKFALTVSTVLLLLPVVYL